MKAHALDAAFDDVTEHLDLTSARRPKRDVQRAGQLFAWRGVRPHVHACRLTGSRATKPCVGCSNDPGVTARSDSSKRSVPPDARYASGENSYGSSIATKSAEDSPARIGPPSISSLITEASGPSTRLSRSIQKTLGVSVSSTNNRLRT